MLYPSIDKLLKIIDSKYSLVTVAAKRARNLQEVDNGLLDHFVSQKYVGKALEEIYAKKLVIKTDDEKVQG
ncbi:DNA-directed RNA polymerase subunit omega [Heyndrickxia camelliae]|uniref:DNA-directed RNA polymerase subunit omega n=1 Tax=Heyndrickxia camelliae TaxID=1707093 RepID=A0A2N3LR23_9BACI|nr:DNA-directed RNA polymerase subunit omega [Heyndrickxia camelliae]PKR87004.1 DNA-directed RNA polymerase subunit omega [Heyndrickxia camelliae]